MIVLFTFAYRLLFHSDRELTFLSLIFCVSCAFCVAQLAEDIFTDVSGDKYRTPEWLHVLTVPRRFIASCARPVCLYSSLGPEARQLCARMINLVGGNESFAEPPESE